MPVKVDVADQFYRDASKLQKRYPNLLKDLRPLRAQLEAGETPGDRLQDIDQKAYKVRIPNRDANRGKSGGYRVIYYLKTAEKVVIITIYSKSDQSDISIAKLHHFIREYETKYPSEK